MSTEADVIRSVLMYFVLPLWLFAGFADYLCHRASHIATTSGPKESLIHLLMLAEIGIAVTAAMTFEINAAIIVLMIIVWAAHEATAVWDVTFAHHKREVTPIEQWVHSYLGVLPLLSLLMVVVLHWSQFLALFGFGTEAPRFDIVWKDPCSRSLRRPWSLRSCRTWRNWREGCAPGFAHAAPNRPEAAARMPHPPRNSALAPSRAHQ
jgi:hypothetical protein